MSTPIIAIVCALAALYVSAHLCNPKPKAAADYACHAGVILLFVLVFVHLCGCVRAADAASVQAETFATTQGWGADPDDDDAPPADFEAEHATRIVGPDPKADDLQTWQYNPQNTLVDYKFYSKSAAKPDAAAGFCFSRGLRGDFAFLLDWPVEPQPDLRKPVASAIDLRVEFHALPLQRCGARVCII